MRWIAALLLTAIPAAAQDPHSQDRHSQVPHSQDRPPIIPLRDADITYRMVQPVEGGSELLQRMRWSIATGRLRVDPPSPALYMIVDYRAKRMAVVHPADAMVLDMDAAGPGLPGAPAGDYLRQGVSQAAGLACTDWQTTDNAGHAVTLCITADGVMLRASQGPAVLLEAVNVSYAAQDPAAFAPPTAYRHIQQGE